MIPITLANFETDVIAASAHTPVLVDFWAEWCAPRKTLGPILEKLETEYAGRFILAKIDSDAEGQLASAFGVRSLPTCILLINGQPVDGFMGALPEPQIRAFLDKHLPSVEELAALDESQEALAALDDGDVATALAKLAEAVANDPDNADIRFDYLRLLLQENDYDLATEVLQAAGAPAQSHAGLQAIMLWLGAQDFAAKAAPDAAASLTAQVQSHKRDFTAWHQLATLALAAGAFTQACDYLLEILMRDKTWQDERARKDYIHILNLMQGPSPKVEQGVIPPQDPTVVSYRRRLSSVILA